MTEQSSANAPHSPYEPYAPNASLHTSAIETKIQTDVLHNEPVASASQSTKTHDSNAVLRIAINGFGRIGRNLLRAMLERQVFAQHAIELVAINDIADADTLLHLLKYDSTHGRLEHYGYHATLTQIDAMTHLLLSSHPSSISSLSSRYQTSYKGETAQLTETIQLTETMGDINTIAPILLLNEPQPSQLPWDELQVDVVLECTGHFRSYQLANQHRQAGAKQVIIGAAPFDEVDACVVMGVNDHLLSPQLPIISSVSCTTQALVPLIHTLHTSFGVVSAMMTEIHAVTADQSVLDQPHRDIRRARASGYNIIPTTSSSIAATERVLPYMVGRIAGYSIRVPTIDVAAIDVTFTFDQQVSVAAVKQLLKQASANTLLGIMGYTDEALVSSDFIHRAESLMIDELQIMQVGEQLKVFAWYDNEWGYANRLLDMCVVLSMKA